IGPPSVFGSRNDDLGIGEQWRVGTAQQPENVVGMKVRNQDRLDPSRIDAGRLHVGHHLSRDEHRLRIERLYLTATAGVAQCELAVDVDDERRNRNWNETGRQPGGRQSLFGLVDAGVLEVRRIVDLFPNAVIQGRAYGASHLIAMEAW